MKKRVSQKLCVGALSFLAAAILCSVARPCLGQPTTIWLEDFESPVALDDWFSDGGVWEIGVPTSGPKGARSGKNVAGTVLTGNYPDNQSSRLIGPRILIPEGSISPRLRFWHWFDFNSGDSGQVQIKAGTNAWQTVSGTFASTGGGAWSQVSIDLTGYSGKTIQVGFLFVSRGVNCCAYNETAAGWYLDDVSVAAGATGLDSESFESGIGDWSADGGTWEVGLPTSGPNGAHTGSNVAATVLAGNYVERAGSANGVSSRLVSPSFVVPSADQYPRLRFWHWFNFNLGDSGQVQVRAGTNAWETVSLVYQGTGGGVWSSPAVDLSAYAGQTIQVGFLFTAQGVDCCSYNETAEGWYIDDVSLVTGALSFNSESFELGMGDWSADGGSWEVGPPLSGPSAPHSGKNVAGTVLGGNYRERANSANGATSRLVSPPFVVPSAGQNPRLRFWHWFDFNSGDSGRVQIRAGTNEWTTVSPVYQSTGGGVWSSPAIDLSDYAGAVIRVGFLFQARGNDCCSYNETAAGWYIDDVSLVTGPMSLSSEGFELGMGDWSADRGSWEIGSPTSGPGKAHSGSNVMGTVLARNYAERAGSANGVSSHLISPPFVVPSADQYPRLRFWHWFSFNLGDSGQVQVRAGTNAWETVSPVYQGTGGRVWSSPAVDLSVYAGQTIQVGFLFTAQGVDCCSYNETAEGWFIDDVSLVTGRPVFANPESFELGLGDWSADGGTWETGIPAIGPKGAHEGNNVVGTVLAGNYLERAGSANGVNSRLISPPFVTPSATENPRLRFWHWFNFNLGDSGQVQVRVGTNEWTTVSPVYQSAGGGVWSSPAVDLTPYADQTIQVAFLFKAQGVNCCAYNETAEGWFIDEVRILSDRLSRLPNQTVVEGNLLMAVASAVGRNPIYGLGRGTPEGAAIDPSLGVFTWIPSECQGPGDYAITITVSEPDSSLTPVASTSFAVTVLETNSPPIIDPISCKQIKAGEKLCFPITAFDLDCPEAQILTYSLDQGAPPGATIDSVTGQFCWTPDLAQAAQSHTIVVRVTDNGVEPKSSTATFIAGPECQTEPTELRLAIQRLELDRVRVTIEGAVPGTQYVLQASTNLVEWGNIVDVTATSGTMAYEEPLNSAEPARFYRLVVKTAIGPQALTSSVPPLSIVAPRGVLLGQRRSGEDN